MPLAITELVHVRPLSCEENSRTALSQATNDIVPSESVTGLLAGPVGEAWNGPAQVDPPSLVVQANSPEPKAMIVA